MTRTFIYDGREFPDPDPKLSAEEVRKQLTEFFPELANAETREEKRGEDAVYVFTKRIGTKGQPSVPDVVGILRRIPEQRLRIIELASELLDPQGDLDLDATAERQPEVNLAVAEAETYARATRQAVEALRHIPPR